MTLARLLNLPLRTQEYAALALFGAVVLLAATIVLQAFLMLAGQNEAIVGLREQAGKLIQLANLKDTVKSQPSDTADGDGLLLVAQSASIARADLQSRITAIAQSHNAIVASVGDVPDVFENGLTLIGVRANISGENDAVQKTLVEMESVRPPLLVREFVIQASGVEAADRPTDMSVQFQVYGAIRIAAIATEDTPVANVSESNQ